MSIAGDLFVSSAGGSCASLTGGTTVGSLADFNCPVSLVGTGFTGGAGGGGGGGGSGKDS